jgi:hypothetical protein
MAGNGIGVGLEGRWTENQPLSQKLTMTYRTTLPAFGVSIGVEAGVAPSLATEAKTVLASFDQSARLDASLRAVVRHAWLAVQAVEPDLSLVRSLVERMNELTDPGYEGEGSLAGLDLCRRARVILEILTEHAGIYFSAEKLAGLIDVRVPSANVIKVYICNIRAELARSNLRRVIENRRGCGYRVNPLRQAAVRQLVKSISAKRANCRPRP